MAKVMKCLDEEVTRKNRLYPYEQQTVNFIVQKYEEFWHFNKTSFEPESFLRHGVSSGVLIGHEPGLGKTVISCVALRELLQDRKFRFALVICPKSVIFQWKKHLLDWCPSVSHMVIEGKLKDKQYLFSKASNYSQLIVVISWPNIVGYIEQLLGLNPGVVIADESTEVKNTESAMFLALKRFETRSFRIALSGTPIMNNLTELYAVVDCVCPGYFGQEKDFKRYYADKMEDLRVSEKQTDQRLLRAMEAHIASELEHIMLRFSKESIADEIGQKEEVIIWLDMSSPQEAVYDQCIQQYENKKMTAFQAINKLKQIAEAFGGNSSKIEVCVQILLDLKRKQMKTLVFVDFLETLDVLRRSISEILGIQPFVITGQTPINERASLMDRFQEGCNFSVLLLTIKTGSLGLNLQLASRVVLLSPHWNPQVEQQAISRSWRLGNEEDVKVYKLCCRRCIDEKIVERQLFKRELVNVIGGNETFKFGDNIFEVFERSKTGVEVPCEGGDDGLEEYLQAAVPAVNPKFGQILTGNEVITTEKVESEDIPCGTPTIKELRGLKKMEIPDAAQVHLELAEIFQEENNADLNEKLPESMLTPEKAEESATSDELLRIMEDFNSSADEPQSDTETERRLQALLDDEFL